MTVIITQAARRERVRRALAKHRGRVVRVHIRNPYGRPIDRCPDCGGRRDQAALPTICARGFHA